MASRTTRDKPPGKEKRGSSPSNIPTTNTTRTTTQRVRSPNSSENPVSMIRTHDPTASEKPIPNYLKPTLSSSPDTSKQQGKKTASKTETTQRPTLVRRRSFDKPPSSSQLQRSRVSPNPTLRPSSSFSGKTVSPQKGVPDKDLRTPNEVGKQHTLYARPVNTAKKSGIYIKKHEIGDNSSIVKEKAVIPPMKIDNVGMLDVPEAGMQVDEQELVAAQGEEETVQNGDVTEMGDNGSFTEDKEPMSYEQAQGEIHDKDTVKIVNPESSMIPEQNQGDSERKDAKNATSIEPFTVSEASVEDSLVEDKESTTNFESPEKSEYQIPETETVESPAVSENHDVTIVGVETEESEDKKQEEINEGTNNEMNNVISTDQNVAGKEAANGDEEARDSKEKEVQEVIVERKPDEVVDEAAPRVQMAHGKKEIAVSNDVIEETASKLREQRKNKVKALAGAFETVISLQDPK
ncbi:hypothetical protein OROMI_020187 [Orobanche minor]